MTTLLESKYRYRDVGLNSNSIVSINCGLDSIGFRSVFDFVVQHVAQNPQQIELMTLLYGVNFQPPISI